MSKPLRGLKAAALFQSACDLPTPCRRFAREACHAVLSQRRWWRVAARTRAAVVRLTLATDPLAAPHGEGRIAEGDPLPPADRVPVQPGGVTLGELYRVEAPRLLRYVEHRTGERHAALDLVHDAFARLAGVGSLSELINPAAYLQRITRNLLVDRARRSAPVTLVGLEEWDAQAPAAQEETLAAEDLLQRYEDAVAGLPERTRTIFLLHRADDLTYRQIARRLGVTVWTVEYHMKRAILHLARTLDGE